MVQAILKRLLKIAHPVLEQYVLKLLKSQVPYLGRKWKSRKLEEKKKRKEQAWMTLYTTENMRIISAIYLNCKTVLHDDWISNTSADQDVEMGKVGQCVIS